MILFDNQFDGEAIAEAAHTHFNPLTDRVISRREGGKLLGGAVYQSFTGTSINIHIASFAPNCLCNDLLWVGFHYPFVQLRCSKVLGAIPSDNLRALAFTKRLGFSEEARVRDVFPNADMIIFGMYRDDCRWLSLVPRGIQVGRTRLN